MDFRHITGWVKVRMALEISKWTQEQEKQLTVAIPGAQCLDYLRDLARSPSDYLKMTVEKEK